MGTRWWIQTRFAWLYNTRLYTFRIISYIIRDLCVSYDTLYTVTRPLDSGVFFCYDTSINHIFLMIQSEVFGRTFWLDANYNFKSAPTFVDNTVDYNCRDYVSEWTDLDGVNLDELFAIYRELVTNRQLSSSWESVHYRLQSFSKSLILRMNVNSLILWN